MWLGGCDCAIELALVANNKLLSKNASHVSISIKQKNNFLKYF